MKYTGRMEGPGGFELRVVTVQGWRTFRPVTSREKCGKCGTCWLYCPTQCVRTFDTFCQADLDFCKGCGICAAECPCRAIRMVEELGD